ncbi:16S rRNA (guanine(527)-N(7))-methyltransferase RsmG [bacterium]|nr:16S rRNA (guanine(527)-N(7))-methyltransferase RsmG [bacterium]
MVNYIDFKFNDFFQTIDNYILKTTPQQKEQFELYLEFLLEENKKFNLISRNEKNILERHFLNSALIAHLLKFSPTDKIIDIGSGAGFPGIILKILFPQSHFFLVDSITKKTNFLNDLVSKLNLKKIEIVNKRVENLSKDFLNEFDFVTARAVARLDKLLFLSEPLINQSGTLVFLKGKSFQEELDLFHKKSKDYKLNVYPLEKLPFSYGGDGVIITIQHL